VCWQHHIGICHKVACLREREMSQEQEEDKTRYNGVEGMSPRYIRKLSEAAPPGIRNSGAFRLEGEAVSFNDAFYPSSCRVSKQTEGCWIKTRSNPGAFLGETQFKAVLPSDN
jgi:hypothetical protein